MNLKALRLIALKNGFGEDGKTSKSVVFSTKEHSKNGVASVVDVNKAHYMQAWMLKDFPDLTIQVSTLESWTIVAIIDHVEIEQGEGKLDVKNKWEAIDPEDDVFTMVQFIGMCTSRGFLDYDGFGSYARNVEKFDGGWSGEKLRGMDHEISPSMVVAGKIDESYSHVVWYNR